jgi:hypothetical protein
MCVMNDAAGEFHRSNEDAAAAVGKIQPRAPASDETAERRAEAAQTFEPHRTRRGQAARELRDLAAVRIGGTELSRRQRGCIGRTEHTGPDRIGPQDAGAIERPQPCRLGAGRMNGQPWIGPGLQLKIGAVHGHVVVGVSSVRV